jgi:hypothetical protein
MVCSLKVRDDKVDVVDSKVVGSAKLDWQCDLTQGMKVYPRSTPRKLRRTARGPLV